MRRVAYFSFALLVLACGDDDRPPLRDAGTDAGEGMDAGGMDAAVQDAAPPMPSDAGLPDVRLDPDAACATATATAEVVREPVDIIWMVDSSTSMQPAIEQVTAGINDFVDVLDGSDLDYRVIMLSLRGPSSPSGRFAVCVPPPLAGDDDCGDGDRFFQVDMDVRSTQPVEQFLGTLAQTDGYTDPYPERGSAPWRDLLRPDATKTLVFVTDDNARTCELAGSPAGCTSGDDPVLTATSLEDFPGGGNPFNSRTLGPGILTSEYGDLFEGYTFNALYGWGDPADPDVACTFPGGGSPPSSGPTYTTLVERTGGVRAQLCDGASAWGPFFDAVASTVVRTSRIECVTELPSPPDGMMLDASKVNVLVETPDGSTPLGRVRGPGECGAAGGWHYDEETSTPSQVILCPAACEAANDLLIDAGGGDLTIQFGCNSILI